MKSGYCQRIMQVMVICCLCSCSTGKPRVDIMPTGNSIQVVDFRGWQPDGAIRPAVDSIADGYTEAQVRLDGIRARDMLRRGLTERDIASELSGEGVEAWFLDDATLVLLNRLRSVSATAPAIWIVKL